MKVLLQFFAPHCRSFLRTLLLSTLLACGVSYSAAHGQAALDVQAVNVEANAPVSGVTVHLVNEDIGFSAERTTNDRGRVEWRGLSTSGSYTAFVEESDQFYAARASDVDLRSNFTRSVTLLLTPVAEVELDEVVVEGNRSVSDLNRINAEVSSSLSGASLDDLPVEGRNVTRALYRLPNVTQSTGFFPEAPNVSINGANGLYTNYLIDGMDNNEQFLGGPQFEVPTGMVKDVTVLTSTYSAEYGRTGNGIFNITTKSGGNEVRGEAFYLTRPGPVIDGDTPFAQRDLSGNQVKNGFQRHQGGVTVGGPIQTDQTFYFVNVEHTTDWKDNLLRVPDLGLTETIPGRNHFTYVSGKIDHHWSDQWHSSLRLNANRIGIERQGGGLTGGVAFASAANTQRRDGVHTAFQTTYAADQLVYEGNVQFSWFNWNYANPAHPNRSQVRVQNPEGTTIGVLGHPGFTFDSVENTLQSQQKLTYQVGEHTVKAGADVLLSDHSLAGGGNPAGNYTVRLTEPQLQALQNQGVDSDLMPEALTELPGSINVLNYGVELRPSTFGTRQDLMGLYLEDQFSPWSALTVTGGVRWDYDSLSEAGGGAGNGDWNNVAPRLSLNYGLDERSTLRAGYGMFYDKIVYSIYSDALQFSTTADAFKDQLRQLVDEGILPQDTDVDRVTHRGNQTATESSVAYLEGLSPEQLRSQREDVFSNELRILNPQGYDNPLTHQFSLGYQRQVGAETLFYVDLIHTRSYNLFRLRDLNAPTPYDISPDELEAVREDPDRDPSDLVRSQFEADQTRPTDIFRRNPDESIRRDGNGNPQYRDGVARQIVMTETAGEARYWAANLNLVKERGDDDFAYRVSYTLSRLRNNTDDINFRAETANQFEDEWGPSINDRRHVINGIVSYYPTDPFRLTVASLVQSGQPVNRVPNAQVFGTRDLNGDGRSFSENYLGNSDRWPGEERNSDRLPWSVTVDLGVQYAVPLGAGRIVARGDVFNVFNVQNWSGYSNYATQSNQVQVGPASSGQYTKKNASPPRQFQFGLRYEF